MKPLIKYTGGKYGEYNAIKDFFPIKINNYFEPFFGGGGVFFRLCEDNKIHGKSYINDLSKSLIEFYECIFSSLFEYELNKLNNSWETTKKIGNDLYSLYGEKFLNCVIKKDVNGFLNDEIISFIEKECKSYDINTHNFSISERIKDSIKDKLSRFCKKNISKDEKDVAYKCITTSVCQAFYFVVRDMYNDWNNGINKLLYTKEERSAQWFFIREFCFCSMYRTDRNGNFNIPYGGFGYNSKNFKGKIDSIVSEETKNVFKNVEINNFDFEKFMKKHSFEKSDFIFLDPPYDSTFTDYDGNSFGKEEHKRLFDVLSKCNCNWLIDIGKTDFIKKLYRDFNIFEIDKTYMYQARGEYDNKKTKHLIITNYDVPINSLF